MVVRHHGLTTRDHDDGRAPAFERNAGSRREGRGPLKLTVDGVAGTRLAPTPGMLGTVLEVLLIVLFAVTLLSAAIGVATRMTHQMHAGPSA